MTMVMRMFHCRFVLGYSILLCVNILIDGSPLRGPRYGSFGYLNGLLGHLNSLDEDNRYFLLDYPQPFQINELPTLKGFSDIPLHLPSFHLQVKTEKRNFLEKVYNRTVPIFADWLYKPFCSAAVRSVLKEMQVYHVTENGLFVNPFGATVITIHDITTRTHPAFHLPDNRRFHEKKIGFAERYADLVVASSESTAADLRRHTRIRPECIRVVHLGVDTDIEYLPPGSRRESRLQRFGLGNAPFLLGLGTLEPRKNWAAILEVFRLLCCKQEFSNLKLVLAGGKGWLSDNILRCIETHPNRQSIVLAGFVTPEEKVALYSSCGVFLFPSFYEGFGLPVLEAMRCQAPVICSNIASLLEVGGDGAILVAPDATDTMAFYCERLLSDSAYRQDQIAAGLSWSRRFSWTQCAQQMLDLFKSLTP